MHPILAGIINALVPGLGYLLIRKRVAFGALVLLGTVLGTLLLLVEPRTATILLATTDPGKALEIAATLALILAFGYDAYALAADSSNV